MRRSKKRENRILSIILICFILIILCIIIIKHISKTNSTQEEKDISVVYSEIKNEVAINKLSEYEERDRMEYYVSEFIECVENKKYEEAYSMLYSEFKNNYFPTLEEFETYCKSTFPKMFSVKHQNIERNGDLYVLWVDISDALDGKKDNKIEMNFVIRENDLNDYEMSFSVI